MFDKYIYIIQPKEQSTLTNNMVSNPYYNPESKLTKFIMELRNDGEENIEKLYMLIGDSLSQDKIDSITVKKTQESIDFQIIDNINGTRKTGFNYLTLLFNDNQKKENRFLIEIILKGKYIQSDLSEINSIFTLSINNKLRNFSGDKFYVPRCDYSCELKVIKDCWKETLQDGAVVFNYKINILNYTGNKIKRLKFHEELYICGNGPVVDKIEINDKTVTLSEKDGVYKFKKIYENIKQWQQIVIFYKVFLKEFNVAGAFNFPAITKISYDKDKIEKSCNLKLKSSEISVDSECKVLGKSDAEFIVRISNSENSPASDLLIKDTIIIPKGIKIKFVDLLQCGIYYSSGEPVDTSECFTDTIIELKFKRSINKNSEIEVPIIFTIEEVAGERTSEYIKNIVDSVEILNKKKYYNNICYKNTKAYLRIKSDLGTLK